MSDNQDIENFPMLEQNWLNCTKPLPILIWLQERANQRKLRLFCCACCRKIWHALQDERSRRALDTAEQFADGHLPLGELVLARADARAAVDMLEAKCRRPEGHLEMDGPTSAATAVFCSTKEELTITSGTGILLSSTGSVAQYAASVFYYLALERSGSNPEAEAAVSSEEVAQCGLLRDIFGNPFRPPPALDPTWLRWHDRTIPRLAQQMYDSRDFAALPILADALEEAGCTSADILEHCRGPGPHVRGCWVVDLILGKE